MEKPWEVEAQKKRAAAREFLQKHGEVVDFGGKNDRNALKPTTQTDNTLSLLLGRKAATIKNEDERRKEQEAKLMIIKQQEDARRAKFAQRDELPANWQAVLDKSGKYYYWNRATNQTVWERPTSDGSSSSSTTNNSANDDSSSSRITKEISAAGVSAVSSSVVNTEWEEKRHPGTGQTYFINTETNERSSTRPPVGSANSSGATASRSSGAASASHTQASISILGKRPAESQVKSGPL